MVSWLIVLCLLVIALCRAAPPPMVVVAAVSVVAKSAIGAETYPSLPTICVERNGLREDAGLPEDPDQRDHAQVVGCTGRSGPRVCEGWRDAAGFDGRSG